MALGSGRILSPLPRFQRFSTTLQRKRSSWSSQNTSSWRAEPMPTCVTQTENVSNYYTGAYCDILSMVCSVTI